MKISSMWGKIAIFLAIQMSGPILLAAKKGLKTDVKKIHLVYMTHLDLGYTAPFHDVCDQYFQKDLLSAALLAETLDQRRADGSTKASFVWTQFPWLLQEFLDGAAGCGVKSRNVTVYKKVEEAIAKNQIIWHATPLSSFWEIGDRELVDFGLEMKTKLNKKFGKNHGAIVGKVTDVPGMSRAMVPVLASHGIKAMHMGYNPDMKTPDLPGVFHWLDEQSGKSVLMMIESSYGSQVQACVGENCDDEVLQFYFNSDNTGVPTANAVEIFWQELERVYPNAEIVVSSLDDYAQHLLSDAELMANLPVVSSEIGDAWLYGVASDPARVSVFREARRSLKDADIDKNSSAYNSYMRRLLKIPEHNWGLSLGSHLSDKVSWTNPDFYRARSGSNEFLSLEKEWAAQRLFNLPEADNGCTGKDCEFYTHLNKTLVALYSPSIPKLYGKDNERLLKLAELEQAHQCGNFVVRFNSETGAIDYLLDKSTDKLWADSNHQLGTYSYRTYTSDEDSTFSSEFSRQNWPWKKPGKENDAGLSETQRGAFRPNLTQAWKAESDGACHFAFKLIGPQEGLHEDAGAPADLYMIYRIPATQLGAASQKIFLDFTWVNKSSTRHEEAMFLSFVPLAQSSDASWQMDVLGQTVSPDNVTTLGTRYIHSVWDGITLGDDSHSLQIRPLDTPLVCPGDTEHLFRFGQKPVNSVQGGMHFNLFNNLWPDAFPQWYGSESGSPNGLARFELSFL